MYFDEKSGHLVGEVEIPKKGWFADHMFDVLFKGTDLDKVLKDKDGHWTI